MLWVIVFAAIAVAGLVMLICYAVWLAHKAADVLSEVSVLADRGAQLGELLGQIEVPQSALPAGGSAGSVLVGAPDGVTASDVR